MREFYQNAKLLLQDIVGNSPGGDQVRLLITEIQTDGYIFKLFGQNQSVVDKHPLKLCKGENEKGY